MDRAEKAKQYFLSGYNCSQAVFMAFCDLTGLNEEKAAKISAPFGGGMGRMREVCGAVSGMLMVFGALYGNTDPSDRSAKLEHYKTVQELAGEFKENSGSIICREILKNPSSDPSPTPRDENYYKERPCVQMVITAAEILDKYIKNHG